jgi:hypothetical protein
MRAIVSGAVTALTITAAGAMDLSDLSALSANAMVPHCKSAIDDFREGRFLEAGYCTETIVALVAALANVTEDYLCIRLPKGVSYVEMKRVIVGDMEARPKRMHEPFVLLAMEALRDAWPSRYRGRTQLAAAATAHARAKGRHRGVVGPVVHVDRALVPTVLACHEKSPRRGDAGEIAFRGSHPPLPPGANIRGPL